MDQSSHEKIQLHGFNNLTKSLSFNMYDISIRQRKKKGKPT